MSDIAQQANLGADMTTDEVGVAKTPVGDRAIGTVFLTAVGAVMIAWLYVLARSAMAIGSWIFG